MKAAGDSSKNLASRYDVKAGVEFSYVGATEMRSHNTLAYS